ncbi:MAG: HD domain-containing protein [Candidatus Aenigmarchaeota archaeon]|nr:HD domain-containing protein [Candidatus Aenigmarchaeota archaeon]
MISELPVKKIEKFVKNETKHTESVIHDFSHLKRTAIGARWFVKIMDGNKHDQYLAYIAGLLHDIVRPPFEEICHAKASSEKSREILNRFDISNEDRERIIEAVSCHRTRHEWKDALHQSVFLADKILEQMGAMIVFRRCMYIGECKDYLGKTSIQSIIIQSRNKLKKFTPCEFNKIFLRLARAQYKWPHDFTKALKEKKQWALDIGMYFFKAGRDKKDFEKTVFGYKPQIKEQKQIHKQAVLYLKSRKFKDFEKLI